MTPYYDHAGITIYHGDCREVLPQLSGVDLVVTSPPFNLGSSPCKTEHPTRGAGPTSAKKWNGYDQDADALPEDEYQAQQIHVLRLVYAALREGGSLCYQHYDRYIDGVMISPLQWIQDSPLALRQQIVWDKGRTHRWDGFYFAPSHEYVYWLTKGVWDTGAVRDQMRQWRSVWQVMPVRSDDHPAPFPTGIPERCILSLTKPGAVVVDPYMGLGATLQAAKNNGRRAIGIDQSERYCEIAARRLSQEVLDLEAA